MMGLQLKPSSTTLVPSYTCGHAPAFSAELTYRVSPSPIAAQDRERGAA